MNMFHLKVPAGFADLSKNTFYFYVVFQLYYHQPMDILKVPIVKYIIIARNKLFKKIIIIFQMLWKYFFSIIINIFTFLNL